MPTTQTPETIGEMKQRIAAQAAEDEEFRARLLKDPKPVISEALGVPIPDNFNIQVHEDTGTTAHLVLGLSDRLTDQELEMAAGGRDWVDDAAEALGY